MLWVYYLFLILAVRGLSLGVRFLHLKTVPALKRLNEETHSLPFLRNIQ